MVLPKKLHKYFENPKLFNFVRHILDSGNTQKLRKIIKIMQFETVLDIGCGTGDYIHITDKKYIGVDNSESFVKHCKKKFENETRKFYLMDATKMEFKANSFDASTIINTIHHLSDEQVIAVLKDMARVSKKAVIILDAIPPKFNPISKILYKLDRGANFRKLKHQIKLAKQTGMLKIIHAEKYHSKPGFYTHSLIIMQPIQKE